MRVADVQDGLFGSSIASLNSIRLIGAPQIQGHGPAYLLGHDNGNRTMEYEACVPGELDHGGSGAPAILTAEGSSVAGSHDLTLVAIQLPAGQFGIFVVSTTPGWVPGASGTSNGNLCVGGSIGRINTVRQADSAGTYSLALDLSALPQGTGTVAVAAGETWYFQA